MIRSMSALLLTLLAACSSGNNAVVDTAIGELGGMLPGRAQENSGPPQRAVTRADIISQDVAAIQARLDSEPAPTLLYAAAANGGYVTYVSALRQSVTLQGTQITETRGLGTDLLSARSSGNDPLRRAVPVASWPGGVQRTFEFPAWGAQGRIETYECIFERGDLRELTILQQRHRGVEVSETCRGPSGVFENLHFADVTSGFVWRSLQWVGPQMDLVDLQVLLPYTGK